MVLWHGGWFIRRAVTRLGRNAVMHNVENDLDEETATTTLNYNKTWRFDATRRGLVEKKQDSWSRYMYRVHLVT